MKIYELLGAENTHNLVVKGLKIANRFHYLRSILDKRYNFRHKSLERDIFGLRFRNPIGLAAGFDRNGEIYSVVDSLGFGFIEIGTVTPLPQSGNEKPRLFRLEADKSILNYIGLESKGLDYVMDNLRDRVGGNIVLGCNIGKNTITPPDKAWQDYLTSFRKVYQYVDYVSVNLSSNTTLKEYIPRDKESVMKILQPLFEFRRGQNKYLPILMKISPDLTDEEIDLMADIMIDTPLDGIVATNATTSPKKSVEFSEKYPDNIDGAVSGNLLTERAIEVVRRIYGRSRGTYPIIGCGGLMTSQNVKDMFEAGASLVQLYSGYVYNGLHFPSDVCRSLVDPAYKETIVDIEKEE